jgi:hypothetical protein
MMRALGGRRSLLMKRLIFALLTVATVAVVAVVLIRPGTAASPGATITVNSTADSNSRDGVLTLREAMMLATGDLKLTLLSEQECAQVSTATWVEEPIHFCGIGTGNPPDAEYADTIDFASLVFPTAYITLGSNLPTLDEGDDTIDASSSSTTWVVDCDDDPLISGFTITSNNNTIKGLEIYDCGTGVGIYDSAQNNTIGGSGPGEGNVISDNGVGVAMITGARGNVVKGNHIGTDASGTAAVPNAVGVVIHNACLDNTIGGSGPGEGNVISGNAQTGVEIMDYGSNGNVVEGNYIGTDASGTVAIPNHTGVTIGLGAQNNTIGGSSPGEGNVIAFNDTSGVRVDDSDTTGNTIRGNSIHSNGEKGIENIDGGNTELVPPAVDSVGSVFGTACPNCIIDVYSDAEDEGRVYEGSNTADGDGNWSLSGTPDGPNITATATDSEGNTSEFSEPLTPPWPTPTPTPTATPGVTATPTPPVGSTRTLVWGRGWHNATWSGASTPEEAFACAAGKYAAAYRFVEGGLERYFPDRPDISNMNPLSQYTAFLILITQPVTCTMPVAAASGSSRTLQWGVGWHNEGWSGADGMAPQGAFACADGSYAAAYRLVNGNWERYFPGRPDISNMVPLSKYDAFLILVTAPVNCTMPIAP